MALPFSRSGAGPSWLSAANPGERTGAVQPAFTQAPLSSGDQPPACAAYASALPSACYSVSPSAPGFAAATSRNPAIQEQTQPLCARQASRRSGEIARHGLQSGDSLPLQRLTDRFTHLPGQMQTMNSDGLNSAGGSLPSAFLRRHASPAAQEGREPVKRCGGAANAYRLDGNQESPVPGSGMRGDAAAAPREQDSREAQFSAKATELQHLLHLFQNIGDPESQVSRGRATERLRQPAPSPAPHVSSFASFPPACGGDRKRKGESSGEACTVFSTPQREGDARSSSHAKASAERGRDEESERIAFQRFLALQRLGDSLRSGGKPGSGAGRAACGDAASWGPSASLLTQHRAHLPLSLRPSQVCPSSSAPAAAGRPPVFPPSPRASLPAAHSAHGPTSPLPSFGGWDPRLSASNCVAQQERRAGGSPAGVTAAPPASSPQVPPFPRDAHAPGGAQTLASHRGDAPRSAHLPAYWPPVYAQGLPQHGSFPGAAGVETDREARLRAALLASPALVEKLKRLPGGLAALRCMAQSGPSGHPPLRSGMHAPPAASLPAPPQGAAPPSPSPACGATEQSRGAERRKRRKRDADEGEEAQAAPDNMESENGERGGRRLFTCGAESRGADGHARKASDGAGGNEDAVTREQEELQKVKEERREKRMRRRMRRREKRLRRRARRDLVRLMRRQLLKKREEEERRKREAEDTEQEESEADKPEEEELDRTEDCAEESEERGKRGAKSRDSGEAPASRGRRGAGRARGKSVPGGQRARRGKTREKEETEEAERDDGAEEATKREGKEAKMCTEKQEEAKEDEDEDFNAQRERIERKLRKRLKQLSTGTVMVQRGSRRREGDYEAGLSLQKKLDFLVQQSIACPTLPNSAPLSNAYTITSRFKETNHSSMLSDAARMNLYKLAIETQVARLLEEKRCGEDGRRKAHRVLEIGCGPFCVLSINAARAGAKSIVALEVVRRAAVDAQAFVRMYGFDRVIKVVNAYSKECAFRGIAQLSPVASTSCSAAGEAEAMETACTDKNGESTSLSAVKSMAIDPSAPLEERSTSSCLSSPSSDGFPAASADSGGAQFEASCLEPKPSPAPAVEGPGEPPDCEGKDPCTDGGAAEKASEDAAAKEKGARVKDEADREQGQDGYGPFDLIIHEIIGDICSNEGVADVVDDIQARTGCCPASVPYAARTWFTPCELPRPRHILFPHHRYPLRTLLSPNRVLLQSVDMQFAGLRLSDQFAPLEELLFEEPMRPQLLQKRQAHFRCLRSGKLCGLLLCNEVEVLKGVSIDNRESSAASHWYTNVALLKREIRVRKGDVIVVHSCADLRNYQHVDVREGSTLADVEEIHYAARPGKAPPSSKPKLVSSSAGKTATRSSRRVRSARVANNSPASSVAGSALACSREQGLGGHGLFREGEGGRESESPQLSLSCASSPSPDTSSPPFASDEKPKESEENRASSLSDRAEVSCWRAVAALGSQQISRGGDSDPNQERNGAVETRPKAKTAGEASELPQSGKESEETGAEATEDPLAFPACFASVASGEEASQLERGYTRQYLSRPRFCFCVEIHRPIRRRSQSTFRFLNQYCRSQGEQGETECEGQDRDDSKWKALLESESETSSSEDEADSDLSDSDLSSDDSESSESEEEEGEEEADGEADAGETGEGGKARAKPRAGDSEETGQQRSGKGGKEKGTVSAKETDDAKREETQRKADGSPQFGDAGAKTSGGRQEKQVKIRRLPIIAIDFNEQSPFVDKAVCKGRNGTSGRHVRP
ncbi:conserved hypothetical protein [Neospora caninum Liverpool]|uniref:Uncharacterized protein n=1 Tax=Neospora caninum (strain Liverpool) TaxID=572307 RepID=F0VK93_NEOCL|nr:conserved hypothetical protein [Neospora caninum Liverpool]CBZ54494.1 conserved hypothetical protein [Neospora caninum Liverpool]CEL69207.1 TPA: hypothetical protein BN1204_049230 [Neospora caninum Liverpool]|eukprot:XP_003884524.1 conserved hypothetical protein [Neospora caninum Liverpool]